MSIASWSDPQMSDVCSSGVASMASFESLTSVEETGASLSPSRRRRHKSDQTASSGELADIEGASPRRRKKMQGRAADKKRTLDSEDQLKLQRKMELLKVIG